jgi:putative ABC transport system permease protein
MGGNDQTFALSQTPLGPEVTDRYPEIISYTRVHRPWNSTLISHDEIKFYEKELVYADSGFFRTFSFEVIQGNPDKILTRPNTLVLTRSMARKYFGNEDPVGKVLSRNNSQDLEITGIIEDPPKNSHFSFSGIISFVTLYQGDRAKWMDSWIGNINYYTYIRTSPGTTAEEIERKVNETVMEKAGQSFKDYGFSLYSRVQPLKDIHLKSEFQHDISNHGNITYVYIFIIVAFVILLIAAINFMNLSTARSANRAREVGIRKVTGAKRRTLILQFLGESLMFSLVALGIAFLLAGLLINDFGSIMNRELSLNFGENIHYFILYIIISIGIGLLAGLYPAFYLSSFNPVRVLKGEITRGKAGATFRNILVVVQFAISVVLIISTLIVYSQISYIQNKDLGFQRERVIIVPVRNYDLMKNLESLKERLEKIPGVMKTSVSQNYFGNSFSGNGYRFRNTPDNQTILMNFIIIDEDFVNLFGMKIKSGRSFSEQFGTDENSVIMNEAAAAFSELDNPVGESVWGPDSVEKKIIGIVEDFHFNSLHKEIEPVMILTRGENYNYLNIKLEKGNITETINRLGAEWAEIDPERPFDYFFLDDTFNNLYEEDQRLGKIYLYFTILAIFIALLGLYGLSSFITEQKTKEISIRKVMGASSRNIVFKLSTNFMALVLIANLLAWPVGWYLMKNWMENFAYKAGINPLVFATATAASLLISFLTVSIQSYRASIANPADNLRTE